MWACLDVFAHVCVSACDYGVCEGVGVGVRVGGWMGGWVRVHVPDSQYARDWITLLVVA